jgi:hypothetical protein
MLIHPTYRTHRSARRLLLASIVSSIFAVSGVALAQPPGETTTPQPREDEPSAYPIEIEPHFSFGAGDVYAAAGVGAGLRVSIPVVYSLLRNVPDNLAISFGGDLINYSDCYYGNDCGANYLMLPVAAQWNVFVARRVSLFAEGGLFVYKGFFNGCGPGDGPGCSPPSDFGVLPTIAVGARIHMGDNASFVARIGYPTITLGVSFL